MASETLAESADLEREDSLHADRFTTMEVARRITREHLWPQRKILYACFGVMAVSAATTGAMPFLLQKAVDEVFVKQQMSFVIILPLAIIAIVVTKGIAEYYATVWQAHIGNVLLADLRVRMFETLARADLGWLQRTHSARFVSSFMNDVLSIRQAASTSLVALGQNLLKVVVLTGAMFYMDWRLSILALIAMPVALRFMRKQRKSMHASAKRMFQETGDLGTLVSQTLTGIRVVKAYDREEQETQKARATIDRTFDYIMRGVRTRAASGPTTEALTGVGFALAIFYAGYQGIQGTLTAGQFSGFAAAAMFVYPPMKSIAQLQTTLQEGVAAANRVFGILDEARLVEEKPDARDLTPGRGEIRFENVDFGYKSGEPVLREFSMVVPAGKRVALVGPSGAGKSTVLNLLLRFYDPQSGRVLIDGQDISDCTITSVRKVSALVTQEPVLFDDTVRANITYGSEGASEAEIVAAAKAAVAHDFIMNFPEAYDTPVGEAGGRLSGGQRQRVAFARAMLRNAPILLLDEPTSALDSQAEAQLQAALDELLKGRTVIMIAHRLSTVRKADIIYVMDRGRVVEAGTHEELLSRDGPYARLHRTQYGAPDADLDKVLAADNGD
ncbi:ABC transporter ATP-binding protein [Lutibaculum baratangense]|uniref:Lipid A export ATP-binding/permease protein MsbA n=1 Tax=Lutibaculum baratangense AMV1 TaxID=631454 RepID=V4RI02_9HYPH|nr:ABC transporter ATP-binding protein [Lutibaculum baratangense]ESR24954.1 Lipid A export ATP-binding/permease protein MsbA [Lutibaculum baratangense AMV1]